MRCAWPATDGLGPHRPTPDLVGGDGQDDTADRGSRLPRPSGPARSAGGSLTPESHYSA
ncbi:hypothetical protein ATKI12_4288 [Kitasatospora sp. Ki12]